MEFQALINTTIMLASMAVLMMDIMVNNSALWILGIALFFLAGIRLTLSHWQSRKVAKG